MCSSLDVVDVEGATIAVFSLFPSWNEDNVEDSSFTTTLIVDRLGDNPTGRVTRSPLDSELDHVAIKPKLRAQGKDTPSVWFSSKGPCEMKTKLILCFPHFYN